jgi:hypothetical protein
MMVMALLLGAVPSGPWVVRTALCVSLKTSTLYIKKVFRARFQLLRPRVGLNQRPRYRKQERMMIEINDLRTAVDDMRAELEKTKRAYKEGDRNAQDDAMWDLDEAITQVIDEVGRIQRSNNAQQLTERQANRIADALGMPTWQVLEYWPDALDRMIDSLGSATK